PPLEICSRLGDTVIHRQDTESTATLHKTISDLQFTTAAKEGETYTLNRDDICKTIFVNFDQERGLIPCKKLRLIEINCLSIPDEELSVIVGNADTLHTLSVPGSQTGPRTFGMLHYHFDRIIEFNVQGCPFDSKSVLPMMENSNRL
ncbi:hypothetical protein BGZ82_005661, partial [Podila clonocystis]